jgi:site-specific recombinase XerD
VGRRSASWVILEIELQARIGTRIKNTKNSADFQSISGSSTNVFARSGNRLSQSYVEHKFKQYVRWAGLNDDLKFHSLRHTFATWVVQNGASIYEVQKLLGHSDIKTTQIYAHLMASELHSTVNRISFLPSP